MHPARQKRSAGHDVDVVGQAQGMPAAGSEHDREVILVGRFVFGKAHVARDAKDGILGREIAQGQGGIEAEDEAQDDVLEERSGIFILGAVGFKPLMVVVLAKGVQESKDGREVGHGMDWDTKV
ncbi:MAG: hypothetical protein PHN61_02350 [Methanothrix sp.]|nr:hypothetical protein [Methanothrix sp.]